MAMLMLKQLTEILKRTKKKSMHAKVIPIPVINLIHKKQKLTVSNKFLKITFRKYIEIIESYIKKKT